LDITAAAESGYVPMVMQVNDSVAMMKQTVGFVWNTFGRDSTAAKAYVCLLMI
jgi:hypothetical protein